VWFWRSKPQLAFNALEERLAKLERDQKNLEMEWSNAWDKLKRMMQRIAKRAEVAERGAENDDSSTPAVNGGTESPSTGRLNDRQRQIQQQILRRRAGG
jgi:hypothetical protein